MAVRDHYPLFGTLQAGVWRRYDVEVARAVAERLGVRVDLSPVDAAGRIAVLAHDGADLTIATMGHNTARDAQARFIRPHYYQSQTILVGPRAAVIKDWSDVAGELVCATVGDGGNAEIVSHGGRLMLFEVPTALISALRSATCPLVAQDDSFFASSFIDPAFASRFEAKLAFAPVPWGMAVARSGSDRLAMALDLMSQIFHRDGVFLSLAREERIANGFLERQQAVWTSVDCNVESGRANPACVLPALDMKLRPTRFAGDIEAFEHWLAGTAGIAIALPMLEQAPAWSLFRAGLINSLILVAGALVATLFFAVLLAAALASRRLIPRLVARTIILIMQSSPIVLTLVVAGAISHAFFAYSGAMALGAAILALGLTNGSNAGQAIAEAMLSLRAERGQAAEAGLFAAALGRASTQIISFLVNAAKGTPVASFIGAPELLNSLTDVTAFSASGRATTYALVLVFYIVVIALVVALCKRLETCLVRGQSHA